MSKHTYEPKKRKKSVRNPIFQGNCIEIGVWGALMDFFKSLV